jgi:hypothetical protein
MPDCTHACMPYVCLCGLCAISSSSVISARGVDYLFWLFGLSSVIRIRPRCTLCTVQRPCTCLLSNTPISMAYTAMVLTDLRATAGSVVAGMAATENTVPETQRMPGQAGCRLFRDSIVSASGGSGCACCAGGGWDRRLCARCVTVRQCVYMPCVCVFSSVSACALDSLKWRLTL